MELNQSYFSTNKNILARLFSKMSRMVSSSYDPPDWVTTPHNKSFIESPAFSRGYLLACENVGCDYRIPWRVHQAIWAAHHAQKVYGDFVELGTGKGFIMQAVLGSIEDWNKIDKKLWLYDTFEKFGISGKGKETHDSFYADDLASVKHSFTRWKNVFFIEGDVEKTILVHKPQAISFLHVDLNDGDTEVRMLEQLMPIVSDGAVIILDDYANRGEEVSYLLHNRFFESKGYSILTTPAGQGIVLVKK